jgi:hemolysin activation/secretion protein
MVSLTLNGEAELLHGKLRSELVLTHGLPWFNATRAGDPLASRENADGVFTKARFSADWTGPVYRNTSLRLAGVAQLASGALLSAQEIGLGGSSFGRAFDFSERSADNGVLALAELRTSFDHPARWIDWAQPYLFVDGGKVNGLSGASGGGTLMSAGGGMRTRVGTTFINLESAFPLNTERLDTGDSRPRINMQLMRAF